MHTHPRQRLQIAPESIDDVDEIENYNAEWLTSLALGEAKSRSRKIQRTARMRALDLAEVIPQGSRASRTAEPLCPVRAEVPRPFVTSP